MKDKKVRQKDVVSLFLRRVKKEDLPDRDPDAFKKEKEADTELEEEFAKLQHEMEEIEAPLYIAGLKQAGVTAEELMETLKKSATRSAELGEKYLKEYYGRGYATTTAVPWDIVPWYGEEGVEAALGDPLSDRCETIEVRVCREKVCVSNPMPMFVDDIWLEPGSDGDFDKLSENSFDAHDAANGWSTWNWTYHRHSQTHSGKIIISCSTELVEPATVRGMGVWFEELPDARNGGCARGKIPVTVPNSWGHVKMYRRVQLRYKRPGELWVNWFMPSRFKYYDLWQEQGILVPGTCGPLGLHNVLGRYRNHNYHVHRFDAFPAGTQFLTEVQLSWWVKGNGAGGGAGAHYGLKVRPYIEIEACSWELPESITIHVPDYLP